MRRIAVRVAGPTKSRDAHAKAAPNPNTLPASPPSATLDADFRFPVRCALSIPIVAPKAAVLAALAVWLGASVFTTVNAQQAPGGPGGSRQNRGAGGGGGGGPNAQGQRGMATVLDDQQMQLYREATQKDTEQLRKLDDQLRVAQKELIRAALAEKYDENAVREKAEAFSKIQVEITTLRAKAFSALAPTLKPEQRDQLENSRVGTAMLMGGGMGGGGGPGGPGAGAARPAAGGRRAPPPGQ